MSTTAKTAVTVAIFGSALVTVVSLVVVVSLFNEINTMYDETMYDLGEFKVGVLEELPTHTLGNCQRCLEHNDDSPPTRVRFHLSSETSIWRTFWCNKCSNRNEQPERFYYPYAVERRWPMQMRSTSLMPAWPTR